MHPLNITHLNKGVFGVRHVSVSSTDTTSTDVITFNLFGMYLAKLVLGLNQISKHILT